ncbi:MAG: hypothetical protein FJ249_03315 [Nitrospira sp.]|nr:hypothetical protein [Nitrospira sp.]
MRITIAEKHQVAGLDERERGFNRLVEIGLAEGSYQASLRYETTLVMTDRCETQTAALGELIRLLHERGYRQLRSQRSFRDNRYLGSQEQWIEYQDPELPGGRHRGISGWLGRLRQALGL